MSINFTNDVFPLYATNVVTESEYSSIDAARRNQQSEQNLLTLIEVIRAAMAELRSDTEARMMRYAVNRLMAGVADNFAYTNSTTEVIGNDPSILTTAANGDTVDVTTETGTDNVTLAAGPFANVAAIAADINGQILIRVAGTATDIESTAVNGDTVDVTTVSGTDNVTLAAAPYASLAALIADINGQLVTATEVESYDAGGGKIGFRNTAGNGGTSFTLGEGAGTSFLTKAGITAGAKHGEVEAFVSDNHYLGFHNPSTNTARSFTLGGTLLSKAGITPGTFLDAITTIANSARSDAVRHFQRSANPTAL